MGYEWSHSGLLVLKLNTTLQDVLNLFPCDQGEEPHLPLHPAGEAELEEGHVWIRIDDDLLEYRADGDRASLDAQVTDFLESVAEELAAEGWIDYEIDDYEKPYGPNEEARVRAKIASARSSVKLAQEDLARAEAELRALEGDQT